MNSDGRSKLRDDPSPTAAITPQGTTEGTLGFAVLASDAVMIPPPGYTILGLVGRGGMGIVYRAQQISLNRVVALKTIKLGRHNDTSAAARFEQEAQTIARLQHPHIVAAYDFGRHDGQLFLAMEFVEGQDLSDRIHASGKLDETTTWGLIRQAAAGLAHAASFGIVHRDVKPANMLLLTPPAGFQLPPGLPLLKLTDFGLAFLSDDRRDGRLTVEGTTLGSPHYMAPEQVTDAPVDHRTDIYGLGATAYHMLTGTPPFPGETVGQVLARKIKGDTPRIEELSPHVSPATSQLVSRMMHDQIEARPADYAELLSLIEALDRNAPAVVTTKSRPARSHRPIKWLAAIVIAGLVATTLAVSQLLTSNQSPERLPAYIPTGWAAPLYDGTTLRGWLPTAGQWLPTQDVEGGRIIKGTGILRRSLPQPDKPQPHRLSTYRLTIACDLARATAAELQFGFAASPGNPRLVLRLEKDAYRLGRRLRDDAPLVEIASASRQSTSSDDDGPAYEELRVERHADVWVAFADGKPFAVAKPLSKNELADMSLSAQGGQALFDSPQVTEIKLP